MRARGNGARLSVWGCNAAPSTICFELSLYGAPLKEIPKDSFSLRAAALEKHVHALRARITHLGAAQRRESHILTASRSTRVLAAHQGAGTSLISSSSR